MLKTDVEYRQIEMTVISQHAAAKISYSGRNDTSHNVFRPNQVRISFPYSPNNQAHFFSFMFYEM